MADNQVNAYAGPSSQDRKRKAKLLEPEIPLARVVNPLTLRFLFEKKLRPTNVSGHNGIVIPKVHAQHFISEFSEEDTTAYVFMDDMHVDKVWRFRLRDIPNGKFRKYVIEGTGKYIAARGAKVGDYIIIYKDHEVQRYAIGWRKQDVITENSSSGEVKNSNFPGSDEVAIEETHNTPSPKEVEKIVSDEVAIEGIHKIVSSEEVERLISLASSSEVAVAAPAVEERIISLASSSEVAVAAPADETGHDASIQPTNVKDEPPASAAVDSTTDYHPQFDPDDENNQFTQQSHDKIDEEYVQKNFNMSWEKFLDFDPFDSPPY